jgi:hypothetical protein
MFSATKASSVLRSTVNGKVKKKKKKKEKKSAGEIKARVISLLLRN